MANRNISLKSLNSIDDVLDKIAKRIDPEDVPKECLLSEYKALMKLKIDALELYRRLLVNASKGIILEEDIDV